MQTHNESLQKMANDIAAFFTPQLLNDIPAAAKATAGHIKLFWSPKMRERFARAYDAGDLPNLAPAVVAALQDYRSLFVTSQKAPDSATDNAVLLEGGGDAG